MTTVVELHEEVEKSLETNLEVEVQKDLLQDILKRVERAREKRGVVEILQGIYLYFSNDEIIARAQNSTFAIKISVDHADDNFTILNGEEGGAVFMGNKLSSIVNSMPGKKVKIKIEGSVATISSRSSKFTVDVLDHLEYPRFFDYTDGIKVKIHPDILNRMYSRTVYACSTSETRPALTGVNHVVENDKFTLTSTDSHRLATIYHTLDEEVEEAIKKIVPAPSIAEVQKQLSDSDEVLIYIKDNLIAYDFRNGVVMTSRLIAQNYPETKDLIPQDFLTTATFKAGDLKDTVNRALLALLSNEENAIELLLDTNKKQARFFIEDQGKTLFVEDLVPQEATGDNLHIGFNTRYLLDVLNNHNPDSLITFYFIGSLRPFTIRLKDGDQDNLDLILPVRLKKDIEEEIVIEDFNA